MKKELLIKYIKGETAAREEVEVLDWVNSCEENSQYFKTLNNLWISQNVSDKKADENELREIKKLTTGKRLVLNTFKRYIPYVAAATLIISVGLNFLLYRGHVQNANRESAVRLAYLPTEYKHEIYTEKGVKARILLPDGSKVWLNSDSKLIYPDRFESDIREIEFAGEAYFEIQKDSLRPLIINTNKEFRVQVLGTEFNLKSYDNDKEARTTLYSGSLNVISRRYGRGSRFSKEIVTRLKPMESCIIKENQNPIHIRQQQTVNSEKETAWKDGRIIFDATPMTETIKILERWHGVEFEVKDKSVYSFDITARFKSESIVQIMEMIKYCALIDYRLDSNKVVIFRRKI